MLRNEDVMEKKLNNILLIIGGIILIFLTFILILAVMAYLAYKPIMANFHYKEGVEYKDKGWVDRSKVSLNKAIEIAPDSEGAKKARIYLKTHLPKSDDVSSEAIVLNIKGYRASNYEKDYKKALEYFNQAIEDSPEFEWPYSNKAAIYLYEYKDYDKAIEIFNKAIELNPDYINARIHMGTAYLRKGIELKNQKNYDAAIEMMEKSKEQYETVKSLDPEDKYVDSELRDVEDYLNLVKSEKSRNLVETENAEEKTEENSNEEKNLNEPLIKQDSIKQDQIDKNTIQDDLIKEDNLNEPLIKEEKPESNKV